MVKMKASRGFVTIAVVSVWTAALIGLLIQPAYANFCAANIKSTPPDADVYIDGKNMGKTPYFHSVGSPFTVNVTVIKEGYQKWSKIVVVPLDVVVTVEAELVPFAGGAVTVTRTVTTTVTTTRPTTITTTTTSTTTTATTSTTTITTSTTATTTTTTISTTTLAPVTLTTTATVASVSTTTTISATTVTSTVPTLSTVSSIVTQTVEAIGPATYGAVAVAAIATVAAAILATRRRRP